MSVSRQWWRVTTEEVEGVYDPRVSLPRRSLQTIPGLQFLGCRALASRLKQLEDCEDILCQFLSVGLCRLDDAVEVFPGPGVEGLVVFCFFGVEE